MIHERPFTPATRGAGHVPQGRREATADPSRRISSGSTPTCGRRSSSSRGYGERFGIPDAQLAPLVGAIDSREAIIA